MGLRTPIWENWWGLMDQLNGFPKWVRTFKLAPCKDVSAVQKYAGHEWTTIAYQQEHDGMTVWGFFTTDVPYLRRDTWPAHDAEATPPWLIGMEDV